MSLYEGLEISGHLVYFCFCDWSIAKQFADRTFVINFDTPQITKRRVPFFLGKKCWLAVVVQMLFVFRSQSEC